MCPWLFPSTPGTLTPMLAYVFWHWPAAGVPAREYEQLLVAFHQALAEAPATGFQGSTSFRIDGYAPWLGGSPAYADWYVVDGSSALDILNEAAVSSTRRGPHDLLARATGAGAGSLLQLRNAGANLAGARWASWLSKPKGMPYDAFYQTLDQVCAEAAVSLWRRQMVLGPTPEFGLLSRSRLELPPELDSLTLRIEPIC